MELKLVIGACLPHIVFHPKPFLNVALDLLKVLAQSLHAKCAYGIYVGAVDFDIALLD